MYQSPVRIPVASNKVNPCPHVYYSTTLAVLITTTILVENALMALSFEQQKAPTRKSHRNRPAPSTKTVVSTDGDDSLLGLP